MLQISLGGALFRCEHASASGVLVCRFGEGCERSLTIFAKASSSPRVSVCAVSFASNNLFESASAVLVRIPVLARYLCAFPTGVCAYAGHSLAITFSGQGNGAADSMMNSLAIIIVQSLLLLWCWSMLRSGPSYITTIQWCCSYFVLRGG